MSSRTTVSELETRLNIMQREFREIKAISLAQRNLMDSVVKDVKAAMAKIGLQPESEWPLPNARMAASSYGETSDNPPCIHLTSPKSDNVGISFTIEPKADDRSSWTFKFWGASVSEALSTSDRRYRINSFGKALDYLRMCIRRAQMKMPDDMSSLLLESAINACEGHYGFTRLQAELKKARPST